MADWIADPDSYVNGPPHSRFDDARRLEPVQWVDGGDEPGFWAILRYPDALRVAEATNYFSPIDNGIAIDDMAPLYLGDLRQLLLATDDDTPTAAPVDLDAWALDDVMNGLEDRVRAATRAVLDQARESGSHLDFVHQVALPAAINTLTDLLGVPADDRSHLYAVALRNSGNDEVDPAERAPRGAARLELAAYAANFSADRRTARPQGDLTDVLLAGATDLGALDDIDFAGVFVQLVMMSTDTIAGLMSSGMMALFEHPGSYLDLRGNRGEIPVAVEEMLRWANPVNVMSRVALVDTRMGGKEMKAGDRVGIVCTAANRDADIFELPHAFDIARDPNPHLSLGVGDIQFDLGATLTRLQGRVFFEEVFKRWRHLEQAGLALWQRSSLNNSLRQLPIEAR
ncbi:MAG: cytochrome P450 [Actinomycetota bacterium]